jgi:hypothetical protein
MERGKSDNDRTLRPRPTPGSSTKTASDRYQLGSEEPGSASENDPPAHSASDGYQVGSEDPATFSEGPRSGSSSAEAGDEPRIDPYTAFAEVASRSQGEKEGRDPTIWLPGADELDEERGRLADAETRFNRDAWGGRGNPQVSIRLRPFDFRRLRQAAELYGVRPTTLARMMVIRGVKAILDAELRRDGEFLREP